MTCRLFGFLLPLLLLCAAVAGDCPPLAHTPSAPSPVAGEWQG